MNRLISTVLVRRFDSELTGQIKLNRFGSDIDGRRRLEMIYHPAMFFKLPKHVAFIRSAHTLWRPSRRNNYRLKNIFRAGNSPWVLCESCAMDSSCYLWFGITFAHCARIGMFPAIKCSYLSSQLAFFWWAAFAEFQVMRPPKCWIPQLVRDIKELMDHLIFSIPGSLELTTKLYSSQEPLQNVAISKNCYLQCVNPSWPRKFALRLTSSHIQPRPREGVDFSVHLRRP
jgi:hypothetical protein